MIHTELGVHLFQASIVTFQFGQTALFRLAVILVAFFHL